MTRSIGTWTGIATICLAILFIPIRDGARKAAEDTSSGWITFSLSDAPGRAEVSRKDKDCIGSFETRKQAQRFFIKHGGPSKDPHRLDPDGDGKACEAGDP